MATVVQGPLDGLTEGLLAGAKIASLRHQSKQLDIQNQIEQGKLSLDLSNFVLNAQLAPSRIASEDAQTLVNQLTADMLHRKLAVGGAEADVANVKAQTDESKMRTAKGKVETTGAEIANQLTAAHGIASDVRTLSPDQLEEAVTATMAVNGAPDTPGTRLYTRMAIQHDHQVAKDEYDLNKQKAQSINDFRDFQTAIGMGNLGVKQLESSSPADDTLLDDAKTNLKVLREHQAHDRDMMKYFKPGSDEYKATKQAVVDADTEIAKALTELRNLRKAPATGGAGGKTLRAPPKVGDIVNGYKLVRPDYQDMNNWEKVSP